MLETNPMNRRRFLQLSGAATGLLALGIAGCDQGGPAEALESSTEHPRSLATTARPVLSPSKPSETTRKGRQRASFQRGESFIDELWDKELFARTDDPFMDIRDYTEPMTSHRHFY
jgi:hypothetical protein